MWAASQEGQHCHLPSARLGSVPPRSSTVTPTLSQGNGGTYLKNANRMNSPRILRKASIAPVSKGGWGEHPGERRPPGCFGSAPVSADTCARVASASCLGPHHPGPPSALHSPGEEFASDPAQLAANTAQRTQRLGLAGPRARRRLSLHGVPTSLACPEPREVLGPGRQEAVPVRRARGLGSRPALLSCCAR